MESRTDITREEAIARFGVDPERVGLRPRGWWVVEEIWDEEAMAGAKVGDLCVEARDGGYNPVDPNAFAHTNYRGTACDTYDQTYRYYYYAPLDEASATHKEEEDFIPEEQLRLWERSVSEYRGRKLEGTDLARIAAVAIPRLASELRRLRRIIVKADEALVSGRPEDVDLGSARLGIEEASKVKFGLLDSGEVAGDA